MFKIGDRVIHREESVMGTIVGLTTLSQVVDGDCDQSEKDDRWYEIKWDHGEFIGQECEEQLKYFK